ncbi:hypothetical protein [Wolbachia endosymbiont (group B) of Dolichovespula media]|uniref:hypothetical protein n=1 Tax=Wolbachia endosymbiont (group B) of Dolichovespula media TaxID=2954001 RepID=UPI0021F8FB95|nr:hypothetical protein [Wolbachia endosymbiont (group B) of Dolichovespula media]
MTQKLILSIVLQDIIRNREGMPAAGYWMYFYDKKSPTTLRNAYYKNKEGNVVPAPNPLQLDENGALPHKLYYFVDVDDSEDRYIVELKCCYGNAAAPEIVFTDLPYFQEQRKADPTSAIISDNLFIDGQFNIGLQIDDRGQGPGYVSPLFSQVPIAGLSWQFFRIYADSVAMQDRTDIDRVFIKDITEAERISEGNPRFYLNVICEKFSEKNPPLEKAIVFKHSNALWSAISGTFRLKFYAWKGGDNLVVKLIAVRDFGAKSSTPPKSHIVDEFLIDSDSPKVYDTRLNLIDFVIPSDIGDDQSLTLKFLLPKDRTFNFKATNFYCAEVSAPLSVVDFKYPTENSDLAKSHLLFSSFKANKYSIDNNYNELVFAIDGLKFVDNIGELVSYPKGAKVDEGKINLLKCDGRTLDSREMSPLGIEYKRLYEKLDHAPVTFDMLQTKDIPNWFNAISSEYIKRFVLNNKVKVAFEGEGVVNGEPEGDDIGHLWLETTFHANEAVNYDFQYVAAENVTTCCHSFDVSPKYSNNQFLLANNNAKTVKFANSNTDFPGYFRTLSNSNLIYRCREAAIPYEKGIDNVTKETKANFSIKEGFFYLTMNLDYVGSKYPSGSRSFFNPVYFKKRVYDIGFPLIIPKGSATFLQDEYIEGSSNISQNYFLFSPWHIDSISALCGSYLHSSSEPYEIRLFNSSGQYLPIKTWSNHVIYKQKAEEERTPGKPNVLFAEKNSVITYAMQHKALFTQRCLYVIKFKEVKAGDFIGLKTYNNVNTGNNFDMVIWWSVGGEGKAPTDVNSREFKEIKATKETTPEELADMIASSINNKGTTMFNVPTINDKTYDYYIRY